MSGTISTPVTQGITLTVSPTTISGTGSVAVSAGVAITGPPSGSEPVSGWTIINQGSVTATAEGVAGENGVDLAGGGSITNSGVIAGFYNGVDVSSGTAAITNTGTIDSSASIAPSNPTNHEYDGIYLGGGGSVTNSGTGTIFGGVGGIDIAGGAGTVSNTGTVIGTTIDGQGVELDQGGTVTNTGNGNIYGDYSGVLINGGLGVVTNSGLIGAIGLSGYGVDLEAGGHVTNSGSITGNYGGVLTGNVAATLTNSGYVYGADYGARMVAGGLVTNIAGATIQATTTAVAMAGGTVVNAGTIEATASTGAALLFTGAANDLVVEAGAVFIGAVTGAGAGSVLELGSETVGATGAFSGIGSQVTGFGTITFDSGDNWLVAGTLAGFNGDTVKGFATGDSITLDGVTGLTTSYAAGVLTLTSGATTDTIAFSNPGGTVTVTAASGNTTISVVPCFASGTRIATPKGERLVEELKPGDEVLTVLGEVLPVVWAGHRVVDCSAHPEPERVWPIRIEAHAFAEGAPRRDLYLSPDHAILAQAVLIPAKRLINGTTIRQVAQASVTYHHIELTRHAVILSEGLPTESFLDTGADAAMLLAEDGQPAHSAGGREWPEAQLVRDALACAPIRIVGPEVERVRERLGLRGARVPAFA
jgi:collagen type I/II/III/V/XI/XXIV/XXVII alpha